MFSSGERQNWNPVLGQEAQGLLDRLQIPPESRQTLIAESIAVLSRTVPPTSSQGRETGLVVGYVQSGKTLSFTMVTALARDNNYAIVVIVAGTSVPLNNQSQNRLTSDLGLNSRDDRSWRHIHNPKLGNEDEVRIENILEDWRDAAVPPYERTTLLITVMKHHRWLNHLIDIFSAVNLENIPVLIIDDEADQAGLNNLVNEEDESTTYRRLRVLRDCIPLHTFLQYTATPQGPLLINIIDVLSPDFAITLTPGANYVGGKHIFDEDYDYVRRIPPDDIPTRRNPVDEPPESLLEALRIFLLGVASGLIRDRGSGNRSMMVHPSRLTLGHQTYYSWVSDARNNWLYILNSPSMPGYAHLEAGFHRAYQDLQQTLPNIESFEDLMDRLPRAIRRTELYEVNAQRGRTPQIDWHGSYSHILVGGQALDRGFTVEGLTVTYMPRGVGARRADTIQQRARFFGYKRHYLGYCRIYLEQETLEAFSHYIRHEEDIRARLRDYSNRPLNELRRIFLLPRGLSPTRDSIIDDSIEFTRIRVNERWFYPRAPHESPLFTESNRRSVEEYLQNCQFVNDQGDPRRSPSQRHQVAQEVSLQDVYINLLLNLTFTNLSDSGSFTGVLVVIRQWLDQHPDEVCSIYNINGGNPRERRLNGDGEISFFFQGANQERNGVSRGEIYPGDKMMRTEEGITIQIHYLNIVDSNRRPIADNVLNIAIWVPQNMAGDVMIQEQGGAEEPDSGELLLRI